MTTLYRFTSSFLAASLVVGGCSLTPPSLTPEDQRARRTSQSQQRDAAQALVTLEQERAASTSELEAIEAELAAANAPHRDALRRHQEQQSEFDGYRRSIAAAVAFAADCEEQAEPLDAAETGAALAAALAGYASESERDRALAAMERCRKVLDKRARERIKTRIKGLRAELAVDIEDTFDENNPYSRGQLTTTTKGASLEVRMRGNFEGRARHSQEQVDAWCANSWGFFTKITLRNSHGSFTCSPGGSTRELTESVLANANLLTTWVVAGDQATPNDPGAPPSVPETTQRHEELVAEAERIDAGTREFDTRQASIIERDANARATLERSNREQQARVESWGQKKITRADHLRLAGALFTGLGGAVLIGTVAAQQSGIGGAQGFLPIGLGVSVPVIVTGVLLLIGGGVRKTRVREALGCAGATTMPSHCQPAK